MLVSGSWQCMNVVHQRNPIQQILPLASKTCLNPLRSLNHRVRTSDWRYLHFLSNAVRKKLKKPKKPTHSRLNSWLNPVYLCASETRATKGCFCITLTEIMTKGRRCHWLKKIPTLYIVYPSHSNHTGICCQENVVFNRRNLNGKHNVCRESNPFAFWELVNLSSQQRFWLYSDDHE